MCAFRNISQVIGPWADPSVKCQVNGGGQRNSTTKTMDLTGALDGVQRIVGTYIR